jgi:putative ABC transport system permease protein
LAGRRGRTALLVAAVALSAGLVTAISCGIASATASVEEGIARAIGRSDARLVHRGAVPFPAELVERVRALPGVEALSARLNGSLTLVRADGGTGPDGRPRRVTVQARGIEIPADDRFREVRVAEGTRPAAPGEILLDPVGADGLGVKVGERVRVQRFGPPVEFTVVGIIERPKLGVLQQAWAEVGRADLVACGGGGDDRVSSVSVILAVGTDVVAWCAEHADAFEEPLVLEPAERVRSGFDRQVAGGRISFVLSAAMGMLACAFIIATGLTTAVSEQQRELAIARCVGASRGQVMVGQLLVGLVIAGIGVVIGVPLGAGLAAGLVWWFAEFLPAGLAVPPEGIAIAVAGSLGSGLLGAAFPAFLASRVTPLAALVVRSRPPSGRTFAVVTAAGIACLAGQAAIVLPAGDPQVRFWLHSLVGVPLLFIGWFLLSPAVLRLVARLLGPATGRLLGIPAGILERSLASMPYRFGFTAGALMAGMAILASTASNGTAILDDFREKIRFADAFVFRTSGLSPEQQAAIAAMPGVVAAAPVGYLPVRLAEQDRLGVEGFGPTSVICVGFPPREFLRLNRLDFLQGDPETAIARLESGDAVLVAEQFLTARGLGVGDTIGLGGTEGDVRFEIAGVVGAAGLDLATQMFGIRNAYMEHAVSCVFMSFDAVERHFGTREALLMQVSLAPDPEGQPGAVERAIEGAVGESIPGAVFVSGRSIRSTIEEVGTTMERVTLSVATMALLLACFGVGNVVAAGIAARRHEFGVLRAVGGDRGLVPRLVLAEAGLVAIAGSVSGLLLGMTIAAIATILYRELAGLELGLPFPAAAVAMGLGITLALTLLAALPAAIPLLRTPPRALLASRGG